MVGVGEDVEVVRATVERATLDERGATSQREAVYLGWLSDQLQQLAL